jgi:hypothetical protein
LITGDLNQDAFFRLAKYYQQIISGITNQDIVLDPDGAVHSGEIVRVPFDIAERDITARAVLLTDNPNAVLFGLQTPSGALMGPTFSHPQVAFRTGAAAEMYRVGVPLPLGANNEHVGTWHALIALGGVRKVHSDPRFSQCRQVVALQHQRTHVLQHPAARFCHSVQLRAGSHDLPQRGADRVRATGYRSPRPRRGPTSRTVD